MSMQAKMFENLLKIKSGFLISSTRVKGFWNIYITERKNFLKILTKEGHLTKEIPQGLSGEETNFLKTKAEKTYWLTLSKWRILKLYKYSPKRKKEFTLMLKEFFIT